MSNDTNLFERILVVDQLIDHGFYPEGMSLRRANEKKVILVDLKGKNLYLVKVLGRGKNSEATKEKYQDGLAMMKRVLELLRNYFSHVRPPRCRTRDGLQQVRASRGDSVYGAVRPMQDLPSEWFDREHNGV